MGAWRVEMEMWRNGTMLKSKDDLDETGHAGRCFEMTDIGLHRANDKWFGRIAVGPKYGAERLNLERITELGAGAVRFDKSDFARRHTRPDVSASRMTASCAGPLGAVSPLLGPS